MSKRDQGKRDQPAIYSLGLRLVHPRLRHARFEGGEGIARHVDGMRPGSRALDSRAKCNRALREPDLHVFAKLFENCLKRSLEAKAFSGREIGGDDDVLDFLVGHFVDVDLTRQPAS